MCRAEVQGAELSHSRYALSVWDQDDHTCYPDVCGQCKLSSTTNSIAVYYSNCRNRKCLNS